MKAIEQQIADEMNRWARTFTGEVEIVRETDDMIFFLTTVNNIKKKFTVDLTKTGRVKKGSSRSSIADCETKFDYVAGTYHGHVVT